LARRHARRTSVLRRLLELLALALAGRAASRLADTFGVAVSRDTLIRMVRALPDPEIGQVTMLGRWHMAVARVGEDGRPARLVHVLLGR